MLADLSPIHATLALMSALLVKHAIADYGLQTGYMFRNKGRYLHPGGILHAGIHAFFTAGVLAFFAPAALPLIAAIAAAELVLHYHIDWAKERIGCGCELEPTCAGFWQLHGLDQLLHGLTYVAIAAFFLPTITTATGAG
ncbi:MAG: DUF3307 domain-containing protein [Pseudomonadota bacterium]